MLILCPSCKKQCEIKHVERGRHARCTCGASFYIDGETVVSDYSCVDETPPEKIGPYVIERFVGHGGMGKVYQGIHPQLHIPVAVKSLPKEAVSNPAFKERFIKSARICAKMNHPNVVKVYDFGTDGDGTPYLVLEYIGGGTMYDLLLKDGAVEPRKAAEIGIAICRALEEAQRFGIVHRDIKPDNILVDDEGTYKLSDLGLAKIDVQSKTLREERNYHSDTLGFTSLGTPEYMAPEQAIDARTCDVRADIYSLGVTLYQLTTGCLPFDPEDPAELQRMHLEAKPPIPKKNGVRLPSALEQVILQCLKKNPDDRYASPRSLRADLEYFLAGRRTAAQTLKIRFAVILIVLLIVLILIVIFR